ncbi:MAG: proteasome assembly chaperone family protein [Candidatus Bilamarchaeaceae archaeon]
MTIEIKNLRSFKLRNPTVIVGFPGTGLAGSIAASQLAENLKMDFVGYIKDPEFAPLASIHDYLPMPAARVHVSPQHNIILILSEMSIPVKSSQELAEKIYALAKEAGASQIISLGGISIKQDKTAVYVIASTKELTNELVKAKLGKPIKEGATTGVTGVLLTLGAIDKFPVVAILSEADPDYVDPLSAARALKSLQKHMGISISTAELEKDAQTMENGGLKEAQVKSKVPKKKFEGGSMYG